MEYVPCVLCGADESKPLVRLRHDRYLDALGITPPTSTKVMCRRCGHIYQNPQLDDAEVSRLYRDVYRSEALGYGDSRPGDEYLHWKSVKARRDQQWLARHLPPSVTPGAALEVGCAEGGLLWLLAGDGWRVTGVEATPGYADYARQVFGLEVLGGLFKEVDVAGRQFDLVIALKVLEHSKQPVEFLERVRRLLAPSAWLYLTVPNALRPDQDLNNFLASPHISLFTPATLEQMFRVAGLAIHHVDDDHGFLSALARPVERRPAVAGIDGDAYDAVRRALRRRRVVGWAQREIARVRRGAVNAVKFGLRSVMGKESGDRVWRSVRQRMSRPTTSHFTRSP